MQRIVDGLMAIPTILLAIALMAILEPSVKNVIIALIVVETPRISRTVRASVLSLRERPLWRRPGPSGCPRAFWPLHIFPGTIAPLMIHATFLVALAIIVEASLSFLGAGTPPDVASWGNMMADGKIYIRHATWSLVFPGIALALVVMGANLAGDGLRDTLDPKLARRAGGYEA